MDCVAPDGMLSGSCALSSGSVKLEQPTASNATGASRNQARRRPGRLECMAMGEVSEAEVEAQGEVRGRGSRLEIRRQVAVLVVVALRIDAAEACPQLEVARREGEARGLRAEERGDS